MERVFKVALLGSDPTMVEEGADPVGLGTKLLYNHMSTMLEESRERNLDVELVPFYPGSQREWVRGLASILERCDLLHVEYYFEAWGTSPSPGLYPGLFKLLPRYRHVKLMTKIHEWRLLHPLRKASVLPLVSFAEGILFASKRELSTFQGSLPYKLRLRKPLIDVTPHGVQVAIPHVHPKEILDVRRQLLSWGGVEVDTLIGYFGKVYASKQPDKLLRTLKALLERGVRARLVMAGDFPVDHTVQKEDFFQRIKSLNLENHVVFLGFIADERALALALSACNTVLLLFSDGVAVHKGSFWTALELGVPIITTEPPPGEFDDFLPQGFDKNVQFVHRIAEPGGIAAAVKQFDEFRLPQQRRGISPSWKVIAGKHIAFYRQILGI
jgi:glycosyltransferase involved in cell wall biosynthesis